MSFSWWNAFKRYGLSLRHIFIKQRLLIAFLITSLLPVVFVAFYSYREHEKAVNNKISTYSQQLVDEITRNAARELKQYGTFSENIIMNNTVQSKLFQMNDLSIDEKSNIYTQLESEFSQQVYRIGNLSGKHS
ncbi:hypothetical protein GCM10010913_08520 [Paenibacillus aceti]|uniref:Two-component sensor histidine kinase n=1 Tax=Paenibacillus aceti TaxID=1820010 RepID=A0ABQ1VS75_9BACL|nr:hypothetical protein [Paenibacillus aceti]GGF89409.1 hypothetical protein GCM10010913_08520 [Paenibacillus aceti]